MLSKLRSAICEKWFSKELDTAFSKGYREGQFDMMNTIGFRVRNRQRSLTPARELGYSMAVDAIDQVKKEFNW
jgi:hypothetical protein